MAGGESSAAAASNGSAAGATSAAVKPLASSPGSPTSASTASSPAQAPAHTHEDPHICSEHQGGGHARHSAVLRETGAAPASGTAAARAPLLRGSSNELPAAAPSSLMLSSSSSSSPCSAFVLPLPLPLLLPLPFLTRGLAALGLAPPSSSPSAFLLQVCKRLLETVYMRDQL